MLMDIDHANGDLNCIAMAIYAEAHTQSIEAKYSIAQVILNRYRNGKWGNDICEIVYAKGQFVGVWDIAKGVHEFPSQEDLLKEKLIAHAVYFHHVTNLIGNNAYYFHDDSIARPHTWSGKSKKVKIDNLIFY